MAAPRIDRCSPKYDIRFTTAKCLAGHGVEVAEVGVVESGGDHQVGVQLLVHVLAATAAVLVEFHRDEGSLR